MTTSFVSTVAYPSSWMMSYDSATTTSLWLLLAVIPVLYYWAWSRSHFVRLVNALPGPKYVPLLGNVLDLYVDRDGIDIIASQFSI